MKIPKEIKGRHKIRDLAICNKFLQLVEDESLSEENLGTIYDKIADDFKLSQRHILRILTQNHLVLRRDRELEKTREILWLKRQINKRGPSEKDSADLQEQLSNLIHGKNPQFESHVHFNSITLITPEEKLSENRVKALSI